MSERYEPVSRRPIGEAFRSTANGTVRLCLRLNIHPDVISYLSIVAAAAAAVCFWKSEGCPWLLIVGPGFCYLRLWFNMLDGMVALASGKASWRGEILNDLPDRASDILIFAGVAHSHLSNPIIAYWAALGAVLTAYVGTFGQAVGVQREFSGVMSKPWRMVTLHLGAWAGFAVWKKTGTTQLGVLRALDWTCLLIIAGCVQTIWIRLKRILAALQIKARS